MIIQSMPYPAGGGGGGGSVIGVLVNRSSTDSRSGGTFEWNSEVYDDATWHDNTTNPSRLTVPSGVSLVRPVVCAEWDQAQVARILKNAASYAGSPRFQASAATETTCMTGAIVAVSPGDYFTLHGGIGSATNMVQSSYTWFQAEPISSSLKYALVTKSGNQAVAASPTLTFLTFDTEVADTDAFHSTASNTSRMTVPSGVSLVRLTGSAKFTSTAEFGELRVHKNGATAVGTPTRDGSLASNTPSVSIVSPPLEVVPGDYFELATSASAGTNAEASDHTWFQIEEVSASIKRCLAYSTTGPSLSASTWTTVALDAEVYDTDAIHSTSSNTSRMVVPAGCSRARLTFSSRGASATGDYYGRVIKNGSPADGLPFDGGNLTGSEFLNAMGAWVSVTPGDYFELQVFSTAVRTVSANETWLCLECE